MAVGDPPLPHRPRSCGGSFIRTNHLKRFQAIAPEPNSSSKHSQVAIAFVKAHAPAELRQPGSKGESGETCASNFSDSSTIPPLPLCLTAGGAPLIEPRQNRGVERLRLFEIGNVARIIDHDQFNALKQISDPRTDFERYRFVLRAPNQKRGQFGDTSTEACANIVVVDLLCDVVSEPCKGLTRPRRVVDAPFFLD